MGELVAGQPALELDFQASIPLDVVSTLSLLYRAGPGSGLDPWLIAARRAMPDTLRYDLDLLHGFSGRLLYYVEEPIMRFEPLRLERRNASFQDLLRFLESLPAEAYRTMAIRALQRVRRDQNLDPKTPSGTGDPVGEELGWRRFVEPGLTTTTADEVVPLLLDPAHLRARTLSLFRGFWSAVYEEEYARREGALRAAADIARGYGDRGFGMAFAELTGNRVPSPLVAGINDVHRVVFVPSAHLGSYVSYIVYPPDLVVFFSASRLVERARSIAAGRPSLVTSEKRNDQGRPLAEREEATLNASEPLTAAHRVDDATLSDEDVLTALRALADPTRLRILDMLRERERYAQEIVGQLEIAQSAVSRHLGQLERAGLVTVRPHGGMKYYAASETRLLSLSGVLARRWRNRPGSVGS